MKVVITGAGGHLGAHVTRELLQQGHDVIATDRRENPDLPVPLTVLDLLDAAGVARLIAGADAVVHLGNHAGPYGRPPTATCNENVAMNLNVYQAAIAARARKVVFASSIQAMASEQVNEQPDQQPYTVAYLPLDGDCPPHPTNTYGLSKWIGEVMLRDFVVRPGAPGGPAIDGIALRFPAMFYVDNAPPRYGPPKPRDPNAPPSPVRIAQAFSCLSFPDAARLIAAILRADLPGYRCYLPALSYASGPRVPEFVARHYPTVPLRKPLDQIDSLVDLSRITADTGWTPHDTPPWWGH